MYGRLTLLFMLVEISGQQRMVETEHVRNNFVS